MNSRPRRRVRSTAERMYWDRLSVDERVAFVLGYSVGQGCEFPSPQMIAELRRSISPPAVYRPGRVRRASLDRVAVARVACEAIAAGRSPEQALVVAGFASNVKAAGVLMSRCRASGFEIPYRRARSS